MFVGYALDHAGDCYRMWEPQTGRVHESRDIIWLKQMVVARNQMPGRVEIITVIDCIPVVLPHGEIEKIIDQEILEFKSKKLGRVTFPVKFPIKQPGQVEG
jgi:hypothetical protein